ncbi:MAG TPA: CapA family protein [Polyangiaceae bacterium]|jgi:poly-gamma-glutamate synthesis protein (capsule biosynthesis protein)|nr:CapA family protein [Polyangiaceae bacterium]
MERWIAWILFGLPLAGLGCKDSQAAPAQEVSPPPRAVEAPKVPEEQAENAAPEEPAPANSAPPAPVTLVISAVGDCTLGTDYRVVRAPGTFHKEMDAVGNDFKYPFSGVIEVLEEDDLTIANLETTLSSATSWIEAPFVFSGKPEWAQILKEGSVEVVSVANNHSHDLGPRGHADTLRALEEHGVGYFGYGHVDRRVIKGIEIVNLGYTGGRSTIRDAVARAVRENKRADNLVIVSFHWGIEGINQPIDEQKILGKAAVDAGADLVLGHHPHVLQGIHRYKGREIVYSLGNFVFGGHGNPADKDSMIYQALFTKKDGKVEPAGTRILPVRISTVTERNDYRPVLLEGADKDRVLGRVAKYSEALLNPVR